ncbi:MAG: beta-propeller fold lactonase family protein [Terriglobales bacterium]
MQSHNASSRKPGRVPPRSTVAVGMTGEAIGRNINLWLSRFCLALLAVSFVAQPLNAKVTPRYAYVADPGLGQILEYSINPSTGALAPISGCATTPDPNSPSAVLVDKNGSFLYVANKTANSIWVYAINPSNGCLVTSPAPASYPTAGTGPVSLGVGAHDLYLFVSDSTSAQIDAFQMVEGILTSVAGSPFPACTNGAGITVDTVGSYIYQASNVSSNGSDTGTGAVCELTYGASGKHWILPPVSYTTGAYPTQVALDPVGQFLYVTSSGANTVEAFSINGTGALTSNSTVATGKTPVGVAVNTFGQMVFVANSGGNSVSSYVIELPPAYGSLSVNGKAVTTSDGPSSVSVDQTGRFLYVTDDGGFVSGYTINATTGALAKIAGSPWATGTGSSPVAIATQP